jgi:hypothetical protein
MNAAAGRTSRYWLLALGAGAAALGLALWLIDPASAPAPIPQAGAPAPPPLAAAPRKLRPELSAAATPQPAKQDAPSQPSAADTTRFARALPRVPFVQPPDPANQADLPEAQALREDGVHPHPLGAAREFLQRRLHMIGDLNDALDLGQPDKLRELIKRFRELDPEDRHKLADGYERIADCMDHPGAETREAAQTYYDTERASILRRYIRRYCLEPIQP